MCVHVWWLSAISWIIYFLSNIFFLLFEKTKIWKSDDSDYKKVKNSVNYQIHFVCFQFLVCKIFGDKSFFGMMEMETLFCWALWIMNWKLMDFIVWSPFYSKIILRAAFGMKKLISMHAYDPVLSTITYLSFSISPLSYSNKMRTSIPTRNTTCCSSFLSEHVLCGWLGGWCTCSAARPCFSRIMSVMDPSHFLLVYRLRAEKDQDEKHLLNI